MKYSAIWFLNLHLFYFTLVCTDFSTISPLHCKYFNRKTLVIKNICTLDFPDGLVVKTLFPVQVARVQSLVGVVPLATCEIIWKKKICPLMLRSSSSLPWVYITPSVPGSFTFAQLICTGGNWSERVNKLKGMLIEKHLNVIIVVIVIVQLLSPVWLFATPWTAASQASLSFTIS